MSFRTNYFYYHPFFVGDIGIRFSERGLIEFDISQIFRDLSTQKSREESFKEHWQVVANEISDLDQIDDSSLKGIIVNTITQLTAYFVGELRTFSLPLDFEGGTTFQRMVWESLQDIPYGDVISYKILAENIGNPRAIRAVGGANGKNPLPIIIPCHRVIQANGMLGGYSGGLHIKRALLNLEGIDISTGKVLI